MHLGHFADRIATGAARALLAWAAQHTDGPRREWLVVMYAELDSIASGTAQLEWALGGVQVALKHSGRRLQAPTFGIAVVGLLGLLVLGASAVVTAASVPDTRCTTEHTPNSAPPPSPVAASDFLALGDYDYDRGACAQAIADHTQAIDLDPALAAAYNNRAYTAMRQQDYASALPDLDRAIELRPDYTHALMNRGDIFNYYYNIDRQRAIADYDRVIALGETAHSSVCGHRLLAYNNGWSPAVLLNLVTRGPGGGCSVGK